MSHGRYTYKGSCDPQSAERSNLNPEDDESSVNEGEIPRDTYDEAVVRDHPEEVKSEHVENQKEEGPC